jgi:hypothetical protein
VKEFYVFMVQHENNVMVRGNSRSDDQFRMGNVSPFATLHNPSVAFDSLVELTHGAFLYPVEVGV